MNIIKLNAIDSTNTYLKSLIKISNVKDGTIVITENQTQGRGQRGAKWQSNAGQSLTFSMFKRFGNLDVTDKSKITYGTSIGIKNALQKLRVPGLSIKWPNDIMSYRQKLCGILIENQLEGTKVLSSVIGIGLNVNETEIQGLPSATSMKLKTGIIFKLDEVLEVISANIEAQLLNLERRSLSDLKSDYEAALFRINEVSVFENSAGNQFNGMIKGVNDLGELIVETEDEILHSFELKQIKMLF